MFDKLFVGLGKPEKSSLTSLDLETPPLPPQSTTSAKPDPKAILSCRLMQFKDEAQKTAVLAEMQRRLREWTERAPRPIHVYFGVLPQQGLPTSFSTADGKLTFLSFFDSPFAAKYAFEKMRPVPEIAGCAVSVLPTKAEKWIASGINAFSVNPCRLCGPRNVFRADNLLSHEKFISCFGVDIVQRDFRTHALAMQTNAQIAKEKKIARANLEYLRDHFDAGNPYVHWMIAILAGMEGDMKTHAECIERMEQFGPELAEKLRGKPFDGSSNSQFLTFPDAMWGILFSYGCLDLEKIAKNQKQDATGPG